jgi:hypothetical protein
MGWWKRDRPDEALVDPVIDRRQAERIGRIAAATLRRLETPLPPPPPPVILLLAAPNHRIEFIGRFSWTGGVSPYDPIEEAKVRVPRDKRPLNWWERR